MKAANSCHPFSACPRGFTLLELMTAIAVMGILLGIGVPAFTSMIRANQIAAESSNLVSALTLARSEALKRGVRVSVCAAGADLESCAEEADWSNGWILFEDDFGDAGVIDDSDVLLQSWGAPADGVVLDTDKIAVTFSRQARAEFEATFQVKKTGCSGDQQREIYVDISGRINLTRVACT
jgi:type IV fimbrial biogenesis protein FimT